MVFASGFSGDIVAQDLAKEILRCSAIFGIEKIFSVFPNIGFFSGSVVKPLWSMIRAWMTEGELQDFAQRRCLMCLMWTLRSGADPGPLW